MVIIQRYSQTEKEDTNRTSKEINLRLRILFQFSLCHRVTELHLLTDAITLIPGLNLVNVLSYPSRGREVHSLTLP